nr:T9SS type A sorting domain-containing protein [Candidatus Neomarinimicrobiota bacterium]
NPFNPTTTIGYDLPKDTHVKLMVYNILGQSVITLIDASETAGSKNVVWHGKDSLGRDVSAGVYLVVLQSADFTATRKVVLLK